jgi:transposase-like protein
MLELLEERGLNVDHTKVWRWVQDYGLELEQRPRIREDSKYCRVLVFATFLTSSILTCLAAR